MPYGRHNHSYEAHRHQNGVGATQHQPGVTIPMYCLTPPPPLPTFCHSPLFWINCIARCYKSSQCPTQGVEKNICPYLRQMDPIRQEQRRLTNDYIGVFDIAPSQQDDLLPCSTVDSLSAHFPLYLYPVRIPAFILMKWCGCFTPHVAS